MAAKNGWFATDKEGLAKLIANRPKGFVIYELVQNAWDENTSQVTISLTSIEGSRGRARLIVTDDNPDGFQDISHAYTMYAESKKKADVTKRGRFNLGEKLVLALCDSAKIVSVGNAVEFRNDGTRHTIRERMDKGSRFDAIIRMTQAEVKEVDEQIGLLLPPPNILTVYNGNAIPERVPVGRFFATLATVEADDEGQLRQTRRQTEVELYTPRPGETPMLYEMGIPVVESNNKFHINVMQKVPLNADRDNVTPAYYRTLCMEVLNHAVDLVEKDDATETWIATALEDENVAPEAVKDIITKRFGDKVVTYDPSDPEANNRAVANGYVVLAGRTFNAAQWNNIRTTESAVPAGRMFATPKPFSEDGTPAEIIPDADMTPAMREVIRLTKVAGKHLLKHDITVHLVKEMNTGGAAFGPDGVFYYSLKGLGRAWFEYIFTNPAEVWDLIIHEFGHFYAPNHLSDRYYKSLTRLGGQFVELARTKPELFQPKVLTKV